MLGHMWLFNRLVRDRQLCTREWGQRLRYRLSHIESWSEKQGLELAAECHLARVIQCAHLLELPKRSADDITVICSSCFKLNSLQLRRLLENYIPAPDEPGISPEFIERVVSIAQNTADETARNDGQEIRLMEDTELRLPFLMPDDGYSCEFVKGVPKDIMDYVLFLMEAGICRLIVNKTPQNQSGLWTVHFVSKEHSENVGNFRMVEPSRKSFPSSGPVPQTPQITTLAFRKMNNSLGLSIVAAVGVGQNIKRIFVKSVVPGGAADVDGRLQAGDELLEVDGQSLIGMSQEGAAAILSQTGQVVTLKIAKQSAVYFGLATQLGQQSPSIAQNAPLTMSSSDMVPNKSAYPLPGMVQPFSVRADNRDGSLRRQQGAVYQQAQPMLHGPHQSAFQPQPNMSNYPPEHLRRSQPALGRSDDSLLRGQPFPTNGDSLKMGNPNVVPTGGRFSKSTRPPSDGYQAPVRSKSVPDFDQVDFGGDPRVRPAGGTIPGRYQNQDNDPKRPVIYPSTRDAYSKGHYPPMRPTFVDKGPVAGSTSSTSSQRQYGRSGRPSNPVGSAQLTQSFSPPKQTRVYSPSGVVGQTRPYQVESQGLDTKAASGKSSNLTRYPNMNGLNTIGLNDRQEPRVQPQFGQNRSGNFGEQVYISHANKTNSLSSSQGYRGPPAHQDQRYYPNQRTQWVEEYPPPVPPPPSGMYGNQNSAYVGAGPTDVRQGYQDPRWNPSRPSTDPKMQQMVDQKEPEYAKVRPKASVNNSQPTAVSRATMVSPWVREEKELEAKRREEDQRQMRAAEIYMLEQRPNLTKEESEKLNRLKLDAEFDRRFEEVSTQDDQDDDTEVTPAGRAKLVKHYQQEYELRRQKMEAERLRRESEQIKDQEAKRQWQEQRFHELERQRTEQKQMEMKRQQQQIKQTEDYVHRQRDVDPMYNSQRSNIPPTARPSEIVEETYSLPKKTPQIHPPPPPDRSSSFDVYRTGNAFTPTIPESNYRAIGGHQQNSQMAYAAKKSVTFQTDFGGNAAVNQFQSSPANSSSSQQPSGFSGYPVKATQNFPKHTGAAAVSNTNTSYYRTVEPATPFTPGTNEVFTPDRGPMENSFQRQNSVPHTPGVVGAQEHYLDPRDRIAAAKLANVLTAGSYMTPDRMSFRDKMKHFATEAGEDAPKDRSKISRAQQRLEEDLNIQ